MSGAITAAQCARCDRLTLVGYSGGGVLAVLLAKHRSDVGPADYHRCPLDTSRWVKHHGVSPLMGSLNPFDSISAVSSVHEFHFHGGRDQTVPPEVMKWYIRRSIREGIHFFTVTEYDHKCCWVRDWPELLRMTAE